MASDRTTSSRHYDETSETRGVLEVSERSSKASFRREGREFLMRVNVQDSDASDATAATKAQEFLLRCGNGAVACCCVVRFRLNPKP